MLIVPKKMSLGQVYALTFCAFRYVIMLHKSSSLQPADYTGVRE